MTILFMTDEEPVKFGISVIDEGPMMINRRRSRYS